MAEQTLLYGFIGVIIFILSPGKSLSENGNISINKADFELQHGDRVVLLGNSLIQEDVQYGYIEYALTTRWPERDITFRNLGWTGDTVHGEARSYYTSTPSEYELLIKQVREAKPTVVIIGYGSNEAYKGEEGIPEFRQGLHKLLNDIEKMGARVVLLSPIPQLVTSISSDKISKRNKNLERYTSVISQTAEQREIRFVNLFDPFKKIGTSDQLTNDGIHLNEHGYYFLATVLESELVLPSRNWKINIDQSDRVINAAGPVEIVDAQFSKKSIQFKADNKMFSLVPPEATLFRNHSSSLFTIKALKKGCYTFTKGIDEIASASAKRWSKGVKINNRILFRQAQELRDLIIEKNKLYFRKYRPTNRTYLVGFRSFEQDQNMKELEQIDLFIARLEDKIFQLRRPNFKIHRLSVVK